MPADLAEQCRTDARAAAMRGLRMRAELSAVAALFVDAGIPVMALKGGHLAIQFYENVASRWMDDLDLLVHRKDIERAQALLEAVGYRPQRELDLQVALSAHHHVAPLSRGGCVIELHWSIVPPDQPVAIDVDALWSRSVPLSEEVPGMRALAINDLILHLCVHAACVHGLAMGFQPLIDIAEVCRAEEVDWVSLQKDARDWRAARPVSLTLQLARELVGAAVPAPAEPGWLLETADLGLVTTATETMVEKTNGPFSANVLRLGTQGARQQAQSAAQALSRERVAYIHGLREDTWWLPLLRVWRVVDLFWRYSGSLLRVAGANGQLKEVTQQKARLLGWLRGGI